MQETQVQSLRWEDPVEKQMATHSTILARRIPWTEEPCTLHSMGLKELDITKQLTLSLSLIHICTCICQGLSSREAKMCLSLCLSSAWYRCLTDISKSICHKLNSPLSLSQLMATHLPVAWTQFLKSMIIIFFSDLIHPKDWKCYYVYLFHTNAEINKNW